MQINITAQSFYALTGSSIKITCYTFHLRHQLVVIHLEWIIDVLLPNSKSIVYWMFMWTFITLICILCLLNMFCFYYYNSASVLYSLCFWKQRFPIKYRGKKKQNLEPNPKMLLMMKMNCDYLNINVCFHFTIHLKKKMYFFSMLFYSNYNQWI